MKEALTDSTKKEDTMDQASSLRKRLDAAIETDVD